MHNHFSNVSLGWRLTPAVKKIIIACVVIWATEVITVNWLGWTGMILHLSVVPERTLLGFEIWQPFTYMWLHGPRDFTHILFNMLFLWMFGGSLEASWGGRAFWKFYIICGTGAGIAVALIGILVEPAMPTLGSSGAIYGLVAAFAIRFPEVRVYFFGLFPIKGKHFALIPIVYALADFATRASGTSHVAHLAGLVIGAVLVMGWWRPSRVALDIANWMRKRRLKKFRSIDGDGPPYIH